MAIPHICHLKPFDSFAHAAPHNPELNATCAESMRLLSIIYTGRYIAKTTVFRLQKHVNCSVWRNKEKNTYHIVK